MHFHQTTFKVVKTSKNYFIAQYQFNKFYVLAMDHHYLVGENLSITGIVENLKPTNNSYDFDFNKYLQQENVFKTLKTENIIALPTNNLKFLVNKYISSHVHNDLILKLVFQKNTELNEIKGALHKMSLAYLLNLSGANMYIFAFSINHIFFKYKIHPHFKIPIHVFLFFYLWIVGFPLIMTRVIFGYVITNAFVIGHVNLTKTHRNVLTLLSLVLVNPNFFVTNSWPFLIVAMVFLTPMRNYLGWKKTVIQIAKPLFIFVPLQIYLDWKWNFSAPIQTILIQPVISFLYVFSFLFWWIPQFQVALDFLSNAFDSLISLLSKINLIWNFGQPPFLMLITYYLCFYVLLRHKNSKILWFSWTLITLLFLFWTKVFLPNENLIMLNIGNGSSFVYINKWKNLTLIFDAGVGPGFNKSSLSDYLVKNGINHIDLAFISHNHEDHYNSLATVQENLHVHKVIKNDTTQNFINLKGVKIWLWHLKQMSDENDNSLVILVKTLYRNLLFTGDLTKTSEAELLKNETFVYLIKNTTIDLLQIGHHGSKTSTSETFLLLVNPRMSWISAGLKNKHQFPDQVTLEMLNRYHFKYQLTGHDYNWTYNLHKHRFNHWT